MLTAHKRLSRVRLIARSTAGLLAEGDEGVWKALREWYDSTFEEKKERANGMVQE
jgi:hypothetical protein